MRQTFTTTMPDRAGAFLRASRLIAAAGANITRVSYNKATPTPAMPPGLAAASRMASAAWNCA